MEKVMTVYIHFKDSKPMIQQYNVASILERGNSTVQIVNAFGGEPKIFVRVSHIAVEPEGE